MNIEYTKTTFETRQKLLKEEEDKCSELTAQRLKNRYWAAF